MPFAVESSNTPSVIHEEDLNKAFVADLNIVSAVIYSLVFVLGVTGNGLVIFITGFRMTKTVNTIWFLSLAIADFSFILFLPLRIADLAPHTNWHFAVYMCKFNSPIALLNHYASVYQLVVISIDRCLSVRCPVWARNHRTPRLASFVVVGVWILAVLLCSPSLYFRETTTPRQNDTSVPVCCFKFHSDPEQTKIIHWAMVTYRLISAFIIPFGIITFCYGALALRLRRSRLSLSSKSFKVFTAVTVAFLVLCFPAFVFAFLQIKFYKNCNLSAPVLRIGIPLTYSLVYFNSCLNPILYFFMGRDSKEQLKRSLLSAFENALAEDSSLNKTHTKTSLSTELESRESLDPTISPSLLSVHPRTTSKICQDCSISFAQQ